MDEIQPRTMRLSKSVKGDAKAVAKGDRDVEDAIKSFLAGIEEDGDPGFAESKPETTGETNGQGLEELLSRIDASIQDAPQSQTRGETRASRRASGLKKHVAVVMEGEYFALDMDYVLEIRRSPSVTPIPHTPDWLKGATNLRGEIVSVVDLPMFLGMNRDGQSRLERFLVLRTKDDDVRVGMLVDRVIGIRQWAPEEIRAVGAEKSDATSDFSNGVVARDGEDLIRVLDCDRLLNCSELRQFEAI